MALQPCPGDSRIQAGVSGRRSGYTLSRSHWNRLAKRFNSSVCDITAGERGRVIRELVEDALRRRPRPVVVDVGCGVGTFIRKYGRRFGESVGVDFAERMLRGARRRCANVPRCRWVCAPVVDVPKAVGRISDFTVCMNVLTSPDGRLRRRQWSALGKITKPGGCLLVVLPSYESAEFVARVEERMHPGTSAARSADGNVQRGRARQKHYTRSEIRAAAERAGFRVLKVPKVHYGWIDEGLAPGKSVTRGRLPWDWGLFAVRRSLRP
jgi:SAM-dependent methyltransferase